MAFTLTLSSLARFGTDRNPLERPFGRRFLCSDKPAVLYFRNDKARSAAADTKENPP